MTGQFARWARGFSLIPAVCATIALAACGGPGPAAIPDGKVPAAARVLTVHYVPAWGDPSLARTPRGRPVSVTITDLARVRQVAGLMNRLASTTGTYSCPLDSGGQMNLAFRNRVGGQALATARFNPTCPPMWTTVAGTGQELVMTNAFPGTIFRITGIKPVYSQ